MPRIKKFKLTTKPWGREVLIEHHSRYALKEIYMNQGTRSSLQSHRKKMETIYILSGVIELEVIDAKGKSSFETYKAKEAYTIFPKTKHRVKVLKTCRLVEVSTPELNDLIRHQDDYHRL